MTGNRGNVLSSFFIWLGIGFLLGISGSVIAAPCYTLPVANEVKLVYASGLQPQVQVAAQNTETVIAQNSPQEEEIFLQKGCTQCHEISFYGIAGGVTGPDLTNALYNVPTRYGKTLDQFLKEPEGQMTEMFTKLSITEKEKAIILDLLTKANPEISEESAMEDQGTNVEDIQ